MMSLPGFIAGNIEAILVEWEAFARGIWPQGTVADPAELRDSAEQILLAIVADMSQLQSSSEQSAKSRGHGADNTQSDDLNHASEVHGTARVGSGLNIRQVVSEYRALRASVLRLWQPSNPAPNSRDLDEMIRFNEAIDQSLTRAISAFTRRLDTTRDMFLAILGHDLRNPLAAITLSAKLASAALSTPEQAELLSQIVSSAAAISDLVSDLIQFASSTMGVNLPLTLAPVDIRRLCDEVVRESSAAHDGRRIELHVNGNRIGRWDAHRLRQMIQNLLSNAVQHGSATEPITLHLDCSGEKSTEIKIHNGGTPIPPNLLPVIFDPLVRGNIDPAKPRKPGSVGLGLYIAREIARSHGGTINMTSSANEGTTATVHLPS